MQIRKETPHSINGVPGRLLALNVPPAPWVAGVFANQKWVSESRPAPQFERGARLTVDVRFDDNCRNGRMSFAITGDVRSATGRDIAGGYLHDEIATVFPELAPLIKWHLCATDGPMHYTANTLYLAGDADSSGRVKGQVSRYEYGFKFGTSPIVSRVKKSFYDFIEARRAFNGSTPKSNPAHGSFRVVAIAYVPRAGDSSKFDPHYTLAGFGETWYDCPFRDPVEAEEFAAALNTCEVIPVRIATAWSEGKARELDSARNAAIWPEATDEQLSAPREELSAALAARLPALLAAFRHDMESAGFLWSAPAAE